MSSSATLPDLDATVLEDLDWVHTIPCSARASHDTHVPDAVWFRVLDCGCEAWLCEGCGAHDYRVMRTKTFGRCTRCDLSVGVKVWERL